MTVVCNSTCAYNVSIIVLASSKLLLLVERQLLGLIESQLLILYLYLGPLLGFTVPSWSFIVV